MVSAEPGDDHDAAALQVHGAHPVLDERYREARVELEDVVRDARSHLRDLPQPAALLVLDGKTDELVRVELTLGQAGKLLRGQLERGAPCDVRSRATTLRPPATFDDTTVAGCLPT